MKDALRAERLTLSIPRAAALLQDVSLTVARGEMVALVGESGAGKTMLARAATGLLPDGAVLGGRLSLGASMIAPGQPDWASLRGRAVVMIPQSPRAGLSPVRSVGAQIADAMELSGQGRPHVAGLLQGLGLDPRIARFVPDQLSGGMAQRVAIARALATGARLIIADEPTSALDGPSARLVLDMLGAARDRGAGVLLITHDAALAASRADRMVMMRCGQVIEDGSPATLLTAPRAAYSRAYASALLARAHDLSALRPMDDLRHEGALKSLAPLKAMQGFSVRGLSRPLGRSAGLEIASLELGPGSCLAIAGVSGAGKTTLGRLLARLDPCAIGSIMLDGQDIARIPPHRFSCCAERSRVQMVLQEPGRSFLPDQPVKLGILAALRRFGLPDSRLASAACAAGVPLDLLDRVPAALSQGQLARIALARALAPGPAVLILDEPMAALDAPRQAGLILMLAALKAQGTALILITHDLHAARLLADQLVILDKGRIVETGPTGQVLAQPRHPATCALVAAMPH